MGRCGRCSISEVVLYYDTTGVGEKIDPHPGVGLKRRVLYGTGNSNVNQYFDIVVHVHIGSAGFCLSF